MLFSGGDGEMTVSEDIVDGGRDGLQVDKAGCALQTSLGYLARA
jgi:hypothetical protein